ncbi:MAG: hypothetical protein UU16_C0046G0001 [Candidatus Woesebacteria bacterium GW2011_GWA2_40_7]|uniref:Uncharacterized protein n=3 Tax=Candidatus Woeseibacteriota TaxID=1752722 RepID=A0A0G0UTV4_9BACT|nr:MAG: hypothetical protein UT17_C0006G0001 [Candidatus Woesebacteria bacterium GW2011_GWB1_39_10]KKR72087.1 MAG: hypothetical protein UU16_C0046G0001 [Candidatus Woesebacteria bacterium GW2011_GWA2_40_7]KKR92133.1 MAG: hypothetical protein UU42_C0003G0002 [Candidatus Woesebacteria bacterium GW2011_GWA1_41_13b]
MAKAESFQNILLKVQAGEKSARNGDFSFFQNLDLLENIENGNLDSRLTGLANLTTKEPESMFLNIFLLKRIYGIVEEDSLDNSKIKIAVESMLILRNRGVIL